MNNITMSLLYFYTAVIGLCVGSFLNTVVYRVPRSMSIINPRSHCTHCGERLRGYDNIPVLSYLVLGGRCRFCGGKISLRYPVIELLNMLLWLICLKRFDERSLLFAFVAMAACSVLICIAFIDYEHMTIPDVFNFLLLGIGIAALFTRDGIPWIDRLIGCIGALAFFLLFFYGTLWIMKREGLGGGDVKLMTAAGLLLGWKSVFIAIFIATVSACFVMIPYQKKAFKQRSGVKQDEAMKGNKSREFAFGPFLVFGVLVAMFFGRDIMAWYLGLFGL